MTKTPNKNYNLIINYLFELKDEKMYCKFCNIVVKKYKDSDSNLIKIKKKTISKIL